MTPSTEKTPVDEIASIHSRIKIFEHPFAHQVNNPRVHQYCSYCMRPPKQNEKLMKCGGCDFCQYCSKDCQRLAWKVHRPECRRLKQIFPNLPLTEVLFLSKVVDRAIYLEVEGDKYGWEVERPFKSLVDHKQDIQKDPAKMEHFEKIYKKMSAFRNEEMVPKDYFFDIFCKAAINSHSIHTNAGVEIGMALDLGISKYNHSCRPTCTMVFDGYRICLRPLVPDVDASDLEKAFISYIDVGRSKYVRRRDLKGRWYFDCECSRCSDESDDVLTAIKCSTPGCNEPLLTSETADLCTIACRECGNTTDEERVKEAQDLMKSLPASFDPECPKETLEQLLEQATALLHDNNVYVARLRTALFHITGTLSSNIGLIHKQVYENYKLCFPKADRHVGYQMLHIVKALIEKGKRDEAVAYAFDAMNIFEVCFGLDHPYYLQTLGLWTYLEQKQPKTDEELIRLTQFTDNRPIDIVALLEKANMLPSIEQPIKA